MTPLPGGPWQKVILDDGRQYYYNQTTQVSSWDVPAEIESLVNAEVETAPEKTLLSNEEDPWQLVSGAEGERDYYSNKLTGETAWEKPIMSIEEEFEIPDMDDFSDEEEEEVPPLQHEKVVE